jgi:hypothetical protein
MAGAGKRFLEILISSVAMVHILMAFRRKVSVELCVLGVAVQVSYFMLLQYYPTIPITWRVASPRLGVGLSSLTAQYFI